MQEYNNGVFGDGIRFVVSIGQSDIIGLILLKGFAVDGFLLKPFSVNLCTDHSTEEE